MKLHEHLRTLAAPPQEPRLELLDELRAGRAVFWYCKAGHSGISPTPVKLGVATNQERPLFFVRREYCYQCTAKARGTLTP